MITRLEFTLPEDRDELHMAERGPTYLFALMDMADKLRNGIKHQNKDWEEVSDLFYEILDDRQINIYEEVE